MSKECRKIPIDCVNYRDYDGTCDRDDTPCCVLDGSNALKNYAEASVRDILEKQVLEIARLNQEVERLRGLLIKKRLCPDCGSDIFRQGLPHECKAVAQGENGRDDEADTFGVLHAEPWGEAAQGEGE